MRFLLLILVLGCAGHKEIVRSLGTIKGYNTKEYPKVELFVDSTWYKISDRSKVTFNINDNVFLVKDFRNYYLCFNELGNCIKVEYVP